MVRKGEILQGRSDATTLEIKEPLPVTEAEPRSFVTKNKQNNFN